MVIAGSAAGTLTCRAQAADGPPVSGPRSPLALAAPQGGFRTIGWEALVPPGWDGMKEFRQINMASMEDGDPRATQLLKRMREAWDRAPVNLALIGLPVRIAGYVVPLEQTSAGLQEFLLVPYHGACIHTPPPPANQIVHVVSRQPLKGLSSMDTVWVSGVLAYSRNDSYMGVSSWRLPAVEVQRYAEALKATPLR